MSWPGRSRTKFWWPIGFGPNEDARWGMPIWASAWVVVLFPVGFFITRSLPREMGLLADGAAAGSFAPAAFEPERASVRLAVRSANFWLLLAGSTLAIGAIGTVIFHF